MDTGTFDRILPGSVDVEKPYLQVVCTWPWLCHAVKTWKNLGHQVETSMGWHWDWEMGDVGNYIGRLPQLPLEKKHTIWLQYVSIKWCAVRIFSSMKSPVFCQGKIQTLSVFTNMAYEHFWPPPKSHILALFGWPFPEVNEPVDLVFDEQISLDISLRTTRPWENWMPDDTMIP